MRILYIDVNYKIGSTGQIVYSLFSNCKKNGIESSVCYGRGRNIKEDYVYKFGLDFETAIHALLTRLTGYTGCYSFLSTRRLIKYIKKFKPDIVHIHELHAYFVNIKTLLNYLKKSNIPTVFTNHCEFLYTGKCGLSKDCDKYSKKCGKCPYLRDYPASLFFDHTSSMLKTKKKLLVGWDNFYFVSPSIWLNERMNISFLGKSHRFVIKNGIDTSLFNIAQDEALKIKYKIPQHKKIIASIAPNIFTDNKGGYRFLEIANRFAGNEKIHFIAVGAVDNTPKSYPKNFTILPLIKDKRELVSLYSMADCLVICSHNENFPTTSLEAQCCGTKVVGYDVGGVKETILEGNGFVVPFGNVDEICKRIQYILDEGYSKANVSRESKHCFSSDRMFEEYYNIYKRICH